ncbi:MAG: Rieske 2Fe-2S domain-containing protein [Kouleothrix sp.]
MAEQRNAGRRVISQADADAISAKSGVQKPGSAGQAKGPGVNRREVLAIAMAGSAALLTAGSLLFVTSPDPAADPLLGPLLKFTSSENPETLERVYPVAGGFAYPRIKAGTFGGKFTLDKKASEFKETDDPFPVADGKFFVVKVPASATIQPVDDEDNNPNTSGIMAIYQVCVHLGCLVPYISSEKRFICPCHGSTYERDTQYVRGPAPRDLDQFRVKVVNDIIVVNTGARVLGKSHA